MTKNSSPMPSLPTRVRVRALLAEVTPLDKVATAVTVAEHARKGNGLVVGNLNLHGAYLLHTDDAFADYTRQADLVLIDGAPIAILAGQSLRSRVGSTDWLDEFMPQAAGMRVLAIGGSAETSAATQRHFREQFPDVRWTGRDGYTSQIVDEYLRTLIDDADVVLVGMGMPLQEAWILRNLSLLEGKVVANVGGCFDYYAGTQRLAPRWMGRLGIEWLYRLCADPARLAHRYLVEPFKLGLVVLSRTTKRHQSERRGEGAK